jgi:hypothetical protein
MLRTILTRYLLADPRVVQFHTCPLALVGCRRGYARRNPYSNSTNASADNPVAPDPFKHVRLFFMHRSQRSNGRVGHAIVQLDRVVVCVRRSSSLASAHCPWCTSKTKPSFAAMLGTLRRLSIRKQVLTLALRGPRSQKIKQLLENVVTQAA